MGDDYRHRILFLRLDVNEMNVQPIDVGDEMRNGVYFGLGFAPVVIGAPIPREFLHRRGLNTLRCIVDRFILWPLCRLDAPAQIRNISLGNAHMKRSNLGTTAGLSCNISRSFRNRPSHSFQPPGKSKKTQLARGKGCGGSTKKAAAIEIGHFGHLHARFAVQFPIRGGAAIRWLPKSARNVGAVKKEKDVPGGNLVTN